MFLSEKEGYEAMYSLNLFIWKGVTHTYVYIYIMLSVYIYVYIMPKTCMYKCCMYLKCFWVIHKKL